MKRLLIILAFIVLIGSNLCGHSLMNVMADESESTVTDKYYTSIEIQKGDSLWRIASKYAEQSGMTTNAYLKELKSMNGLKEDIIHVGQHLTIMYFVP